MLTKDEKREYERLSRSFLFLNEAELNRLEYLHEKSQD